MKLLETTANVFLPAINFHLIKSCNLQCKYCYSHFADIKKEDFLKFEQVLQIIEALHDSGCCKINFAGGEPFLHPHLGAFVRYASHVGMKTSIVTNGTLISEKWLEKYGNWLDWIGISCDSIYEEVEKTLGRGKGKHVASTKKAFAMLYAYNRKHSHQISTKMNSVVTKLNWQEDMREFVRACGVERWKIFQVLLLQGENDRFYSDLAITRKQFQAFVNCHWQLEAEGISVIAEDNEAMTESYIMIDPQGCFYQNRDNQYCKSDPIRKIGLLEAFAQISFSKEKFVARGGVYNY